MASSLSPCEIEAKVLHPGLGGENVSLAVNYSQTAAFHSAGYEDITINSSYIGGQVRQHGNFSFSRVYQSSGAIAASQPETAFRIFQRAIFGLDIATGKTSLQDPSSSSSNYTTTGPTSASHAKQALPPQPAPTCYVLDPTTCDEKAWAEVFYGSGVIHQHILLDDATAHLFPDLSSADAGNLTTGKIGDGDGNRLGRGKVLEASDSGGDVPRTSESAAEEGGGGGSAAEGSGSGTVPNGGIRLEPFLSLRLRLRLRGGGWSSFFALVLAGMLGV